MQPTMGRMVRVTWPDGVKSPAVITRTKADTVPESFDANGLADVDADRWGNRPVKHMRDMDVDLLVFGLLGTYPLFNVPMASTDEAGAWHWPPR